MIRLRLLGPSSLERGDGTTIRSVLAQPKRFALLAYLAGAHPPGPRRRETLLGLFWPESDEEHARTALRQSLYRLRRSLGRGVLTGRGEERVGVDPETLWCDTVAFGEALEADRREEALELYRGPFLEGFHISGAPGFERWVDGRRGRLRRQAVSTAWKLAEESETERDPVGARRWAERALELAPYDGAGVRRYLELMERLGQPVAAIRAYEAYAERLAEDLELEPAAETAALVESLRNGEQDRPGPASRESHPPGPTSEAVRSADGNDSMGAGASGRPSGAETQRRPAPVPSLFPRARERQGRSIVQWAIAYLAGHAEKERQRVSLPKLLMLAALLGMAGAVIHVVGEEDPTDGGPSAATTADGLDRHAVGDEAAAVRRSSILLPDSAPLAFVGSAALGVGRTALAISPDGSRLVYVAQRGETTQLALRELDRIEVRLLPGTEGAYQPFFSPDGEWIGFFAGRSLKKVSVPGGHVLTLASVLEPMGGSWGRDGRILVAENQGLQLSWVPSFGGAPHPTEWQPDDRLLYPELLPGGRWILHGAMDRSLSITSLDSGRRLALTRSGIMPRDGAAVDDLLFGKNPHYLESGHIAYISGDGVLMVLPFDRDRLRSSGPPVPIMAGIRLEAAGGGAQLAVSLGGTFVYAPGDNVRRSRLVWVEHASGARDTLPFPPDFYGAFDLSPDGDRVVAIVEPASGPAELWVLDLRSGTRTRVPTEGVVFRAPRWWATGTHVIYSEYGPEGDPHNGAVVRQPLNDAQLRDTLLREAMYIVPSPDGRHVAIGHESTPLLLDVRDLDTLGAVGRADIVFLHFSPDGRWLAYTDFTTGTQSEVYLSRVDRLEERYRITPDGGEEAVWTPDGKALVYRNGQRWFTVPATVEEESEIGRPGFLFEGPYLNVPGMSHDISADGRRQLVLLGPQEETTNELVIVTNWLAEVERAASAP